MTGDPLTRKSEAGALRPTLFTEPVPGNVWPEAKVRMPVLLILKPVSDGAPVPCANSRFRVALEFAVLLLMGSACN